MDTVMVVAERYVDGEIPPCPRNCDVKETAFLFEPFGRPQGHIRGKVAVGGMNDVNRVEFESFRRVDGREDQPVLVDHRRASEVSGGRRRL